MPCIVLSVLDCLCDIFDISIERVGDCGPARSIGNVGQDEESSYFKLKAV